MQSPGVLLQLNQRKITNMDCHFVMGLLGTGWVSSGTGRDVCNPQVTPPDGTQAAGYVIIVIGT
jgi:hypothetical protein